MKSFFTDKIYLRKLSTSVEYLFSDIASRDGSISWFRRYRSYYRYCICVVSAVLPRDATQVRRPRLCHNKSSVCLSVCLWRWGMIFIFTQVGILRK